jgi:hypothetical protein
MPPPQPPSRVPEVRPAGFIALAISGFITFKTALPLSRVVEDFMISQGINAGFSIFEIGAVLAEWFLLAKLIQFIIDEYIVIPLIYRLNVHHAEQMQRQLDGKETWWERHGFKIAVLVLLFFYFTKK